MQVIRSSSKINYYLKKFNIMSNFECNPTFVLIHYKQGELLASPFEKPKYIQFLVEGKILLYDMPTENTFSTIESPFYQANLIGEMELIDPDFQTFFVEAKTDVFTLALAMDEYAEKLLHDSTFLLTVSRSLAKKLTDSVQNSQPIPLREQLLKYFARADRSKAIQDINHFSQVFHVSARQMIRTLNRLCEEGYLEHPQKGTYIITDKITKLQPVQK